MRKPSGFRLKKYFKIEFFVFKDSSRFRLSGSLASIKAGLMGELERLECDPSQYGLKVLLEDETFSEILPLKDFFADESVKAIESLCT